MQKQQTDNRMHKPFLLSIGSALLSFKIETFPQKDINTFEFFF